MYALYLVHEDIKAIKVSFHTVVVLNSAIAAKYPGGIHSFALKHRVRFNNDLAVLCAMSGSELDPLIQDLQQHGFTTDDAVYFDAASYLLEASMTGDYGEIELGAPWLTARCTEEGFFVWHNNEERNHQ